MISNRKFVLLPLLAVVCTVFTILAFFWMGGDEESVRGKPIALLAQDVEELPAKAHAVLSARDRAGTEREMVSVSPEEALETAGGEDACSSGTICGVVKLSNGEPRAGAECRLYASGSPGGLRLSGGSPEGESAPFASGQTDAKGFFELAAPSGFWRLEIGYEGLRKWREDAIPSGAYKEVTLSPEQTLLVFAKEESGAPISQAKVLLLEAVYGDRARAFAYEESDSSGRAEINVPSGASWFVEVSHPSYRSHVVPVPSFKGSMWAEVSVVLPKGVEIHGRVVELRNGQAAGGAEVLVDVWGPDPTRQIPCDLNGYFSTGSVFGARTEVEITARAPGFAETRRVFKLAEDGVESGVLKVELALALGTAVVKGRISAAGRTAPGSVDIFLKPLAEGSYFHARKVASHATSWRKMATTDPGGRFRVEGLGLGHPYQLLAMSRNGLAPKLVRVPPLQPGLPHDLGDVLLEPGGELYGFATHEDGTPAEHVRIIGIPMTEHTWDELNDPAYFPSHSADRRDVFTNQGGNFKMSAIPAGMAFRLYWEQTRESHKVGEFVVRESEQVGPVHINVRDSNGVGMASIRGLVFDLAGAPLESILVEVWSGPETEIVGKGSAGRGLTKADGTFEFGPFPANVSYRVTATDLRGRFEKVIVRTVVPGDPEFLLLELTPLPTVPLSVEGTVVDSTGSPQGGIDIELLYSPLLVKCGCLGRKTSTDSFGRFYFEEVIEGSHEVSAVDRRGTFSPQLVDVIPGRPVTIRMQ